MHRSELNVLRLGAIVAIKRDTVLFFPKTGGRGAPLICFQRIIVAKFCSGFDLLLGKIHFLQHVGYAANAKLLLAKCFS